MPDARASRADLAAIWPMFGIEICTPRLMLRMPTENELISLAQRAVHGVHAPEFAHVAFPWELKPSPQLERGFLQHHWSMRATWTPDNWQLAFGVFVDDEPVGCQNIGATGFDVRRTVTTGSWLSVDLHGRGLGTEMRAAVAEFAFAGLGAQRAVSSYLAGNTPSERISARLGYEPNGRRVQNRDGEAVEEQLVVLTRERWRTQPRTDITLTGVETCLSLLGAQRAADD